MKNGHNPVAYLCEQGSEGVQKKARFGSSQKMNPTLDSVPLTESNAKEVNVAAWVDEEVNGFWRESPAGQEGDEPSEGMRLFLPAGQGKEHILLVLRDLVPSSPTHLL